MKYFVFSCIFSLHPENFRLILTPSKRETVPAGRKGKGMKIYILTENYSTAWTYQESADIEGKLVVATMKDENGNLKTTNVKVRQVLDIEVQS